MKIQFNTDNNIHGTEALESWASGQINHSLGHFDEFITRFEVHLSDVNGHKSNGGGDIQCTLEARIEKSQPIAVTAKHSEKEKALDLAIGKMKAALSTKVGKMREH